MRELGVVGGHAVDGSHGAEGQHVIIRATVAHDADGADGEEDGEGLPGFFVEFRRPQFLDKNRIGFLEDGYALGRDFAGNANGEAGAGEADFFRKYSASSGGPYGEYTTMIPEGAIYTGPTRLRYPGAEAVCVTDPDSVNPWTK